MSMLNISVTLFREEVIAYYQRLTEEAALREQRALWHVRRLQLEEDRRKFLVSDDEMWKSEMEQFPEVCLNLQYCIS